MVELVYRQKLYITGKGVTFVCSFKENNKEEEKYKKDFLKQLKNEIIYNEGNTDCDILFPNHKIRYIETTKEGSKFGDLFGVICIPSFETPTLALKTIK